MTLGYWIIVAFASTATLAVLLATMSESSEWRTPRRRVPLLMIYMIYGLSPSQSPVRDPHDDAWRSALEAIDSKFETEAETEAGTEGSEPGGADTHHIDVAQDTQALVRRRPNGVVILGLPDRLLSGVPAAVAADWAESVVRQLASVGCHSFVVGCAPPSMVPTASIAEMDTTAMAALTRNWNEALSQRLGPLGATVVDSPEALAGIIESNLRRPLTVDLPPPNHRTDQIRVIR